MRLCGKHTWLLEIQMEWIKQVAEDYTQSNSKALWRKTERHTVKDTLIWNSKNKNKKKTYNIIFLFFVFEGMNFVPRKSLNTILPLAFTYVRLAYHTKQWYILFQDAYTEWRYKNNHKRDVQLLQISGSLRREDWNGM